MLRNRRTLLVCASVFGVTLATGCFRPVSGEAEIDAGQGSNMDAGGGGGSSAGGGSAGGGGSAEGGGGGAGGGGGGAGGGGGSAGGACRAIGATDGGGPTVSVPFFPGPQTWTEVNDFDLAEADGCVALTWVSDHAVWSQPLSASAPQRLADVTSSYASRVRAATGPNGLAMVVATGAGTIVARPFDLTGPRAATSTVATTQGGPPFVGVAWNAQNALVVWTAYGSVSFRRIQPDGTFLEAAAVQLTFLPSTFVPRLAVASDGTDWLVAVAATQGLLYRVTAAGVVTAVGTYGAPAANVAMAHTTSGYVLVTNSSSQASQARLLSSAGAQLAGPYNLPDPSPGVGGIVVGDLACNTRECFVAEARPARVDGFRLDLGGAPLGGSIAIDATPSTGEACMVAAGGDGTWLVAYGTWASGTTGPYFGPLLARWVRVSP